MATIEELYQQYLLTQPGIGVSQNRYRDLMSQMRPFANPYPAGTGLLAGGTVAPVVPKTPARTSPMGTYSSGPGLSAGAGMTNPAWDAMTDQQRSEFYANNPLYAKATEIGQAIFSNTLLGRAQALLDPERVNREGLIRQGFDFNAYQKARDEFRQTELDYAKALEAQAQAEAAQAAAQAQAVQDTAAVNVSSPTAVSMTSMQDALNQDIAAAAAAREAERNNFTAGLLAQFAAQIDAQQAAQQSADNAAAESAIGSYGGGSFAEQQAINDAIAAAAAQNDSPGGGAFGGSGYDGGMFGGAQSGDVGFSKGGKVTKDRLKGPNPKGPDEGYGALLGGEFVIQKSAVKKYGEGLLSMINDGKIPAKKMKSLLG